MQETWKPVKDYPRYKVSSLGRVKSINYKNTGREKILKPRAEKTGYLSVMLSNGELRRFKVHRLVAQAFLGLGVEDKLNTVDHINEDKLDNRVSNLRLCTHRENRLYYTTKRRSLPFNICLKSGKYQVSINYGNHRKGDYCKICLGTYKTIEEAVEVRDEFLNDMKAYEGLKVEPIAL